MAIESILTVALARPVLLSAAHLALRAIRFREGAPNMIAGLRTEAAQPDASQVAEVALKLLDDIQAEEGRNVSELTDEQANKYANVLAAIVEERTRSDFDLANLSAEPQLAHMRRDYSVF